MTDNGTGRVWFITGTSSGFGRTLAEAALARGERVVATARDVRAVQDLAGRALVARLDVTDPASIQAAVDTALAEYGRIDVLVNNAGHGLVGALEELSDEQTREVLETNVFGVLAVTRAVLPHFRARRSGHIVQLSSVGGVVATPGHAIYATSKFALEGMSEALAGEVATLGIRVSIVEPGPFRTDFAGRSMVFSEPIDDYRETAAKHIRARFAESSGQQPNDPARAAEAIFKLVGTEDSPLRLPLGPEAVGAIRKKLEKQLADLEAWEAVAVDTRYAD
ncbi:oxidoreductase [Amycolatopsis saalfeldensis]|uniref:NADP-dependent 3-hydroxy acid dehydrogenase YdfG n=1 Tax=Amycolatopsis saalfeldensis TaxID=394193 RepID=A0A1H8YPH5_9PSEU|nr:oxidoreductase [Amycolatopsis saalfeldensis]SEP53268.1 NADP-dependent 3-hydroxy acid dehydrogenase YdfG [Amycolatopsis saalfeldensis]